MTVREILQGIRERLRLAGIADYEAESWLLLDWKLGITRADFYMEPERTVSEEDVSALEAVLKEREARTPLQYLMGECAFMGYTFSVDERVLIPRQDTECLVELAASDMRAQLSEEGAPCVLDLCTGSGCIGIAAAKLCPAAAVTLADISEGALAVARENARALGAQVKIVKSDLFSDISEKFDYILSNPPYIPSQVIEGLMPEVRDHEPRLALDGEEDGLAFYRRIVRQAPQYLKAGGRLYLEIGAEQGEALRELLLENGFSDVRIEKDLAGFDRIAMGQWRVD